MHFLIQELLYRFVGIIPGGDACPAIHQNRFHLRVCGRLEQQLLYAGSVVFDHVVFGHCMPGLLQQLPDGLAAFVGIGSTGIG
ncbi:hypothetical protein D3C71_1925020 [compost metagenome]